MTRTPFFVCVFIRQGSRSVRDAVSDEDNYYGIKSVANICFFYIIVWSLLVTIVLCAY